jgi:hypothetical protein
VGGGDAARAARFGWPLAIQGIGREEDQQLRDGSLLPARTLPGQDSEEVVVLGLKRLKSRI